MPRLLLFALLTAALVTPVQALATAVPGQPPDRPQWGRDYTDAPEPVGDSKHTQAVVLYYSIVCPHCFRHDPEITRWQREHPKIQFVRKSVILRTGKKVEFAMAAGHLDRIDPTGTLRGALFTAIHEKQVQDVLALKAWMRAKGLGAAWVTDNKLRARVERDTAQAKGLQLTGVPALVVHGRYVITSSASALPLTQVLDHVLAHGEK